MYTDSPRASRRQPGAGDVLIGGPGADILVGSSGDDQFVGDQAEDIYIGYIAGKDVQAVTNTPPMATVSFNTTTPTTNETLVATANAFDNENDTITLTYVWTVGSTVVQTTAGTTALTDTLDLSLAGNGDHGDTITVTVTPNDGVVDGSPATASATVVNTPPTATPQSTSTLEDTPLDGTLAGADDDNDTLTFALAGTPTGGTATVQSDGSFTFTPDADFNGAASFQFTVSDGAATSEPATVAIDVQPVNDAPVAADQSLSTDEDTATPITLGAADVDGDSLSYAIVAGPSHGTLSGTAPNLTYTPAADYNGSDSFTFQVNDGTVNSNIATVSIAVAPVNDPPTASVTLTPADPQTNDVLTATATAADVDGDSVTFSYVWKRNGVTISGQTGNTLDLSVAENGDNGDTIAVEVTPNDGTTDGDVVSASTTVANSVPTVSDSGSVAENEGGTASNTGTFADADADMVTLTASIGTVTWQADGTWSWSFDTSDGPAENQTITISADDGHGGTASKSFGLTVNNVAPTGTLSQVGTATYGDDATVEFNNQVDPSPDDAAAGFHYAYSIDDNGVGLASATYANTSSNSANHSFSALSAGTHTVFARIIDKDDGYSLVTVNITVDPKQVSVTPNAASKTYGDADPTLTGTLAGFLTGDSVTATYSRTAGENVAGSPYTISAVLSSSGDLNNYAITYNAASFTIDERPITVTANDASRAYGDANPSFTGSITGIQNSDNITATYGTSADASTAVGNYNITPALSDPDNRLSNYTVTTVDGTLTISKRISQSPRTTRRGPTAMQTRP